MITNNVQYGQTGWSNNVGKSKDMPSAKDLYLKLSKGDNVLRIITDPYQFLLHKFKPTLADQSKATPADKFGHRILCSKAHGSCPVCASGDKPKLRYLIGVFDRKSSQYKVLEFGPQVYNDIKKLNNDEDWGDPKEYDVNIFVDPDAGPAGYYKTLPKKPKALTAQEQSIIDAGMDLKFLESRTSPPTPDKVTERFSKILSDAGMSLGAVLNGGAESSTVDHEDDDVFPNADAQGFENKF